MVQPEELTKNEPLLWSVGTGTEVWNLFCACAAGDLETVETLVGENSALVRAHYEYRTALYFAVRENRLAVAQFLIDRGANPFYNGEDLIEMAKIRRLAEMEALIERQRPKFRRTVAALVTAARIIRDGALGTRDIWAAAGAGAIDRVTELLDRDPSLVNLSAENGSGSPLVHAAQSGHIDVVRLLLERGADPNLPEEGNAPHGRALYAAVYNRHFDVAKLLLEHGANPNQEAESSADAPSIAIMNSDAKMIELLASYGGIWTIPVQLADS